MKTGNEEPRQKKKSGNDEPLQKRRSGKKKTRKMMIVRGNLTKQLLNERYPSVSSSKDFKVAFTNAVVEAMVHDLKKAKYLCELQGVNTVDGTHLVAVHDIGKINPVFENLEKPIRSSKYKPGCD